MVYTDPPFNTGRTQTRRSLTTVGAGEGGDRTGFGGRRYTTKLLAESSYKDAFEDYLGFLAPRLEEIKRILHPTGTLYLHLDYREAHYVKLFLDELFGRECFLNELIWAYDYGAKPKGRWPQKHDTILVYVKDPRAYYFDSEAVDREPYMAPGLVTPEKVARGKRRCRSCGTRSSPPPAARRPAIRPRSPRACCGASCRPPRARATSASTRSPARARSERSRPSSAAATC